MSDLEKLAGLLIKQHTELYDDIGRMGHLLLETKNHIHSLSAIERYNMWLKLRTRSKDQRKINQHGFKVFSMNDQDGIIQKIFKIIGTTNKNFIEFGCGDGAENNTHYLLTQGWSGLWIDGMEENIKRINERMIKYIDNKQLTAKELIITKANVDETLADQGDVDLMVIDCDRNDYWYWQAIESIRPRVVCIEYNASFPPPVSVTMPYQDEYVWHGDNSFGVSLSALGKLAEEKGYSLIGCSLAGTDAFFIEKDAAAASTTVFIDHLGDIDCLYEPPRYYIECNLGHPPGIDYWEIV
jgi:hypothetical protein